VKGVPCNACGPKLLEPPDFRALFAEARQLQPVPPAVGSDQIGRASATDSRARYEVLQPIDNELMHDR
jgi:hypothetical protein